MTAQFLVFTDNDLVDELPAAQDMRDHVGTVLATTYPGYHWRVEAYPCPYNPKLDFFHIRPEEIAAVEVTTTQLAPGHLLQRVRNALRAYIIKPNEFYSASSLKAEIIRGGGTCLEAFNLSRRALDPADWLTRPRVAGLLVLPAGVH